MRRTILLVNGGKREPIRRLESDPTVELIVVTEPRYAALHGPNTKVVFVDDLVDFKLVASMVLEALSGRTLDAVVAPTERSQPVAGYLRQYFGVQGVSFDVANACSHKYVMKRALAAAGVPVAKHRLLTSVDHLPGLTDELAWPRVIKPVLGAGSALTYAVESPQAAAQLLASHAGAALRHCGKPLIVEEFVDMQAEYHCDGVIYDGSAALAIPSRYFAPVLGKLGQIHGSVTLAPDDPDYDEVRYWHDRVLSALGLDAGVTHLELYKTSAGFVVGEVACRPGGAGIVEHVRLHSDVDLWDAFIRTSLGDKPNVTAVTGPLLTAHVQLPIACGRITEVSSEQQLRDVPNVVDAQVTAKIGDIIEEIHSSAMAGVVYLQVADEAILDQRLAEITSVYQLTVDPIF